MWASQLSSMSLLVSFLVRSCILKLEATEDLTDNFYGIRFQKKLYRDKIQEQNSYPSEIKLFYQNNYHILLFYIQLTSMHIISILFPKFHLLMPSNLKQYMQSQSRQQSRIEQAPEQLGMKLAGKFVMSRNECVEEINQRLRQLQKRQAEISMYSQNNLTDVLRKFQEEYSLLSKQVIRQVQTTLRQNKERLMKKIRQSRSSQLIQIKPIRKNIQQLRSELYELREGLNKDRQYREFISRIVRKDFQAETEIIRADIKRLKAPTIKVYISDQPYTCFKTDLTRIIEMQDNIVGDSRAKLPPTMNQQSQPSANLHMNRDQMKKTQNRWIFG